MNPKIRCRIPTLAISFLAAAMLLLIVGVAAQSQGPAWAPTSGQPLPVTTPATLALPVGEVPPAWQKLLDVGGKLPQLPEAQGSPLGWGGPGAFGYTYADSDEAWGPSPVFEDISAIGTPVAFSDFYRAVELPFAFPFYGTTYTQTYLYRDCSGCYSNPTHLAFLDPYGNYTGFIPWMDYVDRGSGAVYVYSDTLTTPARFIIQYDEVFNYYRGITTTSEVILYQNGDILLRYAEGFSDWLSWYPGWQIPWLWTPWYGPFYYAGAPRSDFAVEFYYPEGAWLWPPGRQGANPAGGQATYSFELRNNTGATDSFTLTSSGNLWPTNIEPTVTGPISDGHSIAVAVAVSIPPGALPGDADGALIAATSISLPAVYTAAAAISTTALCTPTLTFSGQTGMAASLDNIHSYGGQGFTYLYVNAHTNSGTNSIRAQLRAYDPGLGQWQVLGSWDQVGPDQLLIDQYFVPPSYSAIRVSMEGLYGYHVGYDYSFMVCRAPAIYLQPASQQALAAPGTTAVYTLTLTNYMLITDTFDLTATGNLWPTTFWRGGAPITTTGSLADLEAFTFNVHVDVPAVVPPGQVDLATVRAASLGSPAISATAGLTTSALCSPALVFSGQTAAAASLDDIYDYAGQRFTYLYANAHTTSGTGTIWAQLQAYDPGLGQWQTLGTWYDVGPDQLLIDQAFIPPAYSAVRVAVDDHHGDQVYYDYQFVVCREPAVALAPPQQHRLAQAGTTAIYTLTLTDYTMATAVFELTATGNTYSTTFWHNGAPITTTGPLADLEAFTFIVQVELPPDAGLGDSDLATIQAASSTTSRMATLTTAVLSYPWVQAFSNAWSPAAFADRDQYLDIVGPGGITTAQLTDDSDEQADPPAVAAYPREAIVAAWAGPSRSNSPVDYNNIEYTAVGVTGSTVVTLTQLSDNAGAAMHTADRYPVPAVAQVSGNVLIAWYRLEDDVYSSDWRGNIYYAVRDPAGRELLPPTALTHNITYTVQDNSPSTAAFGDGRFAVVWQRYQNDTGIADIIYAVLDSAGGLITGTVNLTTNPSGGDYLPRANSLADGNVLLTWHGYHDSAAGIYYAVLNSTGTVVYPIHRLAHAPDGAYAPDAVGLRSGRVVIAWSHYGYFLDWTGQIAYAVLDSDYSRPNPGETPWTGTYYNNEDLSGSPVVTRTDATIDFQWGTGFPNPAVYTDHFSVRWTGTITPSAGNYLFTMGSDDGSRLWIDEQLLLDRWDASGHYSQTVVPLTADPHQVRMEMHEVTGTAWAELTWQPLLPNPLSRDNYYLSLTRDARDNAVLTWTDGAFERIYYAVVDGLGTARTTPMVFRTRHEWTDISQWGAGNGSLPELTLAISKVATPDPVQAGGLLTYAITVHNTGFAAVTGVAISDTVPASTAFVSADSGGALVGNDVSWTSMTLAAGGRLMVQFVVEVDDSVPAGTLLANAEYGVKCTEVPTPLMGAAVSTTVYWRWRYLPLVLRNH